MNANALAVTGRAGGGCAQYGVDNAPWPCNAVESTVPESTDILERSLGSHHAWRTGQASPGWRQLNGLIGIARRRHALPSPQPRGNETYSSLGNRKTHGRLLPASAKEMESLVRTVLSTARGDPTYNERDDVTDRPWYKKFFWGDGRINDRVWCTAFVNPNEHNFLDSKQIIEGAPHGVAVAVGSFRGLFLLPLNRNIESLIMADSDPRIRYFNELNLELLRVSNDRKTYKALLFAEDFGAFSEALKKTRYVPKIRCLDLGSDPRHYSWFHRALTSPENKGFKEGEGQYSACYVHDDRAFEHVKRLADAGEIVTRHLNICSPSDLDRIGRDLETANRHASLWDISNAWWRDYTPRGSRDFILAGSENI
jgi:hypothetical protein